MIEQCEVWIFLRQTTEDFADAMPLRRPPKRPLKTSFLGVGGLTLLGPWDGVLGTRIMSTSSSCIKHKCEHIHVLNNMYSIYYIYIMYIMIIYYNILYIYYYILMFGRAAQF